MKCTVNSEVCSIVNDDYQVWFGTACGKYVLGSYYDEMCNESSYGFLVLYQTVNPDNLVNYYPITVAAYLI